MVWPKEIRRRNEKKGMGGGVSEGGVRDVCQGWKCLEYAVLSNEGLSARLKKVPHLLERGGSASIIIRCSLF